MLPIFPLIEVLSILKLPLGAVSTNERKGLRTSRNTL